MLLALSTSCRMTCVVDQNGETPRRKRHVAQKYCWKRQMATVTVALYKGKKKKRKKKLRNQYVNSRRYGI